MSYNQRIVPKKNDIGTKFHNSLDRLYSPEWEYLKELF